MKDSIVKHVLICGLKYKDVDAQSVLRRVIAEDPSAKETVKEVLKSIEKAIKECKKLSKEEKEKRLKKLGYEEEEKEKVGPKVLPELKKVNKPYVFRFEPSPSGAMHIGHIITLLLNAEYAKKYKGKLVVRIADTNPEAIYSPAYNLLKEDAMWITQGKVDELIIQSNRMDDYYMHAMVLIEQGHMYICQCNAEAFRELVNKRQACPCRSNTIEENKRLWQLMLTKLDDGEAVARIKTDIHHKNPAVREWPAFRIDTNPHALHGLKYRVWPLMNFAVAVDDHDAGLTHVIRGKDHIVNMERQMYIYKFFKWDIPEFIHIGRVNFKGIRISKSGFRESIEKKEYTGWDDPRLPTLAAFRRRGLQPQAFVRYVQELGPSKVDKRVEFDEFMKSIYKYDREVLDKNAKRYFVVEHPRIIKIVNAPFKKVQVPLHPDRKELGAKEVETTNEFYIEDEVEDGKTYRFMHLFNFVDYVFLSEEHDPKIEAKLIHWVPAVNAVVKIELLMPDGTIKECVGEPAVKYVRQGEIVQFERKGFARFEKKEGDVYQFIFTHQ